MASLKSIVLGILIAIISMGCSIDSASTEYYLFVGTYTDEDSEGIYLYKFNADDGSVDSLGVTSGVENPSYLTVSPDHANLYAVNELADSSEASVSAFAFDKETEELTLLNKQSSLGGAPCYVSIDDGGQAVFAGNYLGGSVSMFPVRDDGSLEEAAVNIQHQGSSINKDRQESPHVHCTYLSPDNNYLMVNDLGTDKIYGYAYDSQKQDLKQQASFTIKTEAGAGPRHLTLHPDGKFAYLINELNGTVVAFEYQADSLQKLQTISTLPEDYDGAISGADIHVSPDGQFLYVSNREDLNNIVVYAIDQQDGMLEKISSYSSGDVHPRNFTIDPTGNYLLAANRNTDNVVIFERNKENGSLSVTGNEIEISQPVCLKMIPVE